MHILRLVAIGDKGHETAVAPARERQTGLLPRFAQGAVLGRLAVLKFAAHADPFVVVEVILLFRAVQHQIFVAALEIDERRVDGAEDVRSHGVPPCICLPIV